jgi:hypothetical protein
MAKPKIYKNKKEFDKANQAYADSLEQYNYYNREPKNIEFRKGSKNIPIQDYIDRVGKDRYNSKFAGTSSGALIEPTAMWFKQKDGMDWYSPTFKKPTTKPIYQPDTKPTETVKPTKVIPQDKSQNPPGYDKKYPPIYLTNPKDSRIGFYTEAGNQYLYKAPQVQQNVKPKLESLQSLPLSPIPVDNKINIQIPKQEIIKPKTKAVDARTYTAGKYLKSQGKSSGYINEGDGTGRQEVYANGGWLDSFKAPKSRIEAETKLDALNNRTTAEKWLDASKPIMKEANNTSEIYQTGVNKSKPTGKGAIEPTISPIDFIPALDVAAITMKGAGMLGKGIYNLASKEANQLYKLAKKDYISAKESIKDEIYNYKYKKDIKNLENLKYEAIQKINNPEGWKRLREQGIDQKSFFDQLNKSKITSKRGAGSWDNGDEINIDFDQLSQLKKENYDLSIKNVLDHEIGHRMQRGFNSIPVKDYNKAMSYNYRKQVPEKFVYTTPLDKEAGNLLSPVTKDINHSDANYFLYGSDNKERLPFLRETKQSMVENKYIDNIYSKITPDIIKKYLKETPTNRFSKFLDTNKDMTHRRLSTLLNKTPIVTGAALGAGALQAKDKQKFAEGGWLDINDTNGQGPLRPNTIPMENANVLPQDIVNNSVVNTPIIKPQVVQQVKPKLTNFEQRINKPTEVIKNNDGTVSTHKMMSFEADGKYYAAPTIVKQNGKLVELSQKDAQDYAFKNNEFKEFKTDKEAKDYANNGYKKGTPLETKQVPSKPKVALPNSIFIKPTLNNSLSELEYNNKNTNTKTETNKPQLPFKNKEVFQNIINAEKKRKLEASKNIPQKPKSDITDKFNTAVNVFSGLVSNDDRVSQDTKGYIRNKLLKEGVINEETIVEKTKVDESAIDSTEIPFQKLATVRSKESPNDNYISYRRQASNSEGLRYIPTPRKEKWKGFKKNATLDKMGYETGAGGENITNNVEGIAHFLIDADISGDTKFQYKNTKSSVEALKKDKTKWLPVYKKEKDGSVIVKYTQGPEEFKNLEKEGYTDFANLRQMKVSDINWKSEKRPIGFGPNVRNLTDTKGKDTFLLFRPTGNKTFKGKDAMGKFEGNSLVMIFKDNAGKAIIREYAGSLNGIISELNQIKSKYKIKDNDITLGFYDAGSYSAKPGAKNGVLKSSVYGQFNDQAVSGAALAIPTTTKKK